MLGARGPWKKLREIGKGSFGLVYLVQRGNDDRKFVMKEVSLRGLPRAELINTQNEVAVLRKLKHPHIIAIEEALVVDETLCIVMEWAEGKDLSALIAQRKQQNRPFTEEEVLKIFWQLCSALAYCHHDCHMLHRDLKPQNVFMAANGDVKLGDFGLAKVIEATCALAKTQCGTPVYMSPELCLGQDYNRGADVYALGCILYELMTLTPPWAGTRQPPAPRRLPLAATAHPPLTAALPPLYRREIQRCGWDVSVPQEDCKLVARRDSVQAALLARSMQPPAVACPSKGCVPPGAQPGAPA